MTDWLKLSEEEWKRRLTPEQFRVLRGQGTECAFTGEYHEEKASGTYACAACDQSLFHSRQKFNSGTGWPSYWDELRPGSVLRHEDRSIPFMPRVEVICSRCHSHLGHVFDDGPPPTGLRYCINSVALRLIPDPEGLPSSG